jgi:hypothetical protein
MPDSKTPQRRLAPAEPDLLLQRAAELVSLTPRLVAKAREQVRWSQELRLVAESLRSDRRPGAVTPARPTARTR